MSEITSTIDSTSARKRTPSAGRLAPDVRAQRLDAVLSNGVAAGAAPGLVAMLGDAAGTQWTGTAGERSPGVPMTADTVFRIFSMSKAIGTAAAMVLVDRGQLDLNATVDSIDPEFARIAVLDGFDGDAPRMRAPRSRATVGQLASHTCGFVYEFFDAEMAKALACTGHPSILSGLESALFYPMHFDPGTRWAYGIGIDWLGRLVERVDGRRIDRFCREELFDPLAMHDTTFECEGEVASRLASVHARNGDGGWAPFELSPPAHPQFYGMGHALYSTAGDYLRFLRLVLNRGTLDGRRVLSEAAVQQMLANQIGDLRVGQLVSAVAGVSGDFELVPGTPKTHGYGFVRTERDTPGMRAAGSQGWAGVLNTHFWFDPARDVAALIMAQTVPFADPRFIALYEQFERTVYAS